MTAVAATAGHGAVAGTAGGDDSGAVLRRVARGGSFAAVGAAGAAILGFVLTLVVTRELSTNSAGIFFSATAAYIVLQTFLSFGVGAGVVRFIPRLRALGRGDEVPALLVTAIAPVIGFGVVGTTVAWFGSPVVARHISHGDPSAALTALRVLSLLLLAGVLETAVVESTRGFGSIKKYVLVHQIFLPLSRPLLVFVAVRAGAPLWGVVLAWSAPLPIAVAMAAAVVKRSLAAAHGARWPWPPAATRRALAREYWSFTGTRGIASVMEILLTWLDVLIVAAVVSPSQAAIYAAASRFVTSGTLVLQALRLAIAPELSAALARNERERASELYRVATQWVIIASWPLYLGMAVFAPRILHIFGPGYPAGATALSVLCIAMLVNTATGNVGTVLLMGGRSRWVLADKAAALAVNVVGNIVLTTRFGITGAAIAWAATIVLDSALAVGQVRYGMKIAGPVRTLVLCGTTALLCFGAIPLIGRLADGSSIPTIAWSAGLATLLYLPLIWRMRATIELPLLFRSLGRRPVGRHRALGQVMNRQNQQNTAALRAYNSGIGDARGGSASLAPEGHRWRARGHGERRSPW